jgi:MFS family permease
VARAGNDAPDRSVLFLLLSLLCSSMAIMTQTIVLGKQVFDISHRELDLGFLGLAEVAPSALLVLDTGSVADRLDRRRVAAVGEVGQAVAIGGILWYVSTGPTAVGPIFLLVLVFGVGRAFSAPASRALPADIVPPERLPWVVARYSATWQVASIVGPVAGGFLYAADVRLPYVFVIALLAIGAVAVLAVRPHPAASHTVEDVERLVSPADVELDHGTPVSPKTGLSEAFEGLRFIRRHPVLLGAISLDLFAVLFGGAVALLPAIAEERLGVGAVGLGWLRAAGGIGAAVVTIRLAMRPLERRIGPTLLVAVGVFGAATIVLGATRSFAVAFVAIFVAFGADALSVFIRGTLVPLVTPKDKRGRVLAVEMVFIGASNELGAFESGVAGELMGPAGAVILGGTATLVIASGWSALFPELRSVDRFPQSSIEERAR